MGVRLGGYGRGALTEGDDAGGMGRGRGLASGAFLRLGVGCTPGETPSISRARTRRLMAALLTSSPGSDLE